ncbi:hypothetical protein [Salinibacter virus M31CR41-3]|nr:hypothetical protein [Salinibacter virus M31CR41-3]
MSLPTDSNFDPHVEPKTTHAKDTTDRVDRAGVGQKVRPDEWDEDGVIVDVHPKQDKPFLVERMHDPKDSWTAFRQWIGRDSFTPINTPSQ